MVIQHIIVKHMIILAFLGLQTAQPNRAAATQQDSDRVSEAVALFRNKQYDTAMSQFRDLGEKAIHAVLNLIQSEELPVGLPMFRLFGFISSIESETANRALIELLSAKRAFLRGQSAGELARRKVKAAIPNLIQLVDDKEICLTTSITDPYREQHTLVRDTAIDALEAITGEKLSKNRSYEEKAKAWAGWWHQQRPIDKHRSVPRVN
jgi:HEAT repeat protein